jgi:hypothetical protein
MMKITLYYAEQFYLVARGWPQQAALHQHSAVGPATVAVGPATAAVALLLMPDPLSAVAASI